MNVPASRRGPQRSPRFVLAAAACGAMAAAASNIRAGDGVCDEWGVIPAPDGAPGGDYAALHDLTVVSPDEIWAAGEYGMYVEGRLNRFTYTLRWDGFEWREIPSPSPSECRGCTDASLAAIAAVPGTPIAWAAGSHVIEPGNGGDDDGDAAGTHHLVLRWDGGRWQTVDTGITGPGAGDGIHDIEVLGPDDVWFVGSADEREGEPQRALALHWDGTAFEAAPVPIVNPESGVGAGNPLNAIAAISPDDIWAVGETAASTQGGPYLQIQHWDGQRWTPVIGPMPGRYNRLYAVAAIAPEDVWAGGEYWDQYSVWPLLLHWDGVQWTQVAASGRFADFHVFAGDDIYAAGWAYAEGGAVFHYDGVEWALIETFPDAEHPSLSALDAAGPCDLWAAGRVLAPETYKGRPLTVCSIAGDRFDLSLTQSDLRRGEVATFTVAGALPGETVRYLYSLRGVGDGPCLSRLGGLCLNVLSPVTRFGEATADGNGTAILERAVPGDAPLGRAIFTQAVVRRGSDGAESVKSNAVTAAIRP